MRLEDVDNIVAYHPKRNDLFPLFRRWDDHPKWRRNSPVYLYEFDPIQLRRDARSYSRLSVPHTVDKDELLALGFLEIMAGIPIFARNVRGSCLPEDDVLVFYQEPATEILAKFPLEVEALEHIASEILGPREGRQGSRKGGIAFEKDIDRSNNNHQGSRCYNLGTSHERQRGICHPSLNMSCLKSTSDDGLDVRKRLNQVCNFYACLLASNR